MLSTLIPMLPFFGLLFVIILGYVFLKNKLAEYNEKFTSMFTLLSAMTDEINKLKMISSYQSYKAIDIEPTSDDEDDDVDDGDDDINDDDYEEESDDEEDEDVDEDEDEDEEDDNDDNDDDQEIDYGELAQLKGEREEYEEEQREEEQREEEHDDHNNLQQVEVEHFMETMIQNKNDAEESDTSTDNATAPQGEMVTPEGEDDEEDADTQKEIVIDEFESVDFSKMSLKELRNLAKQRGLNGENVGKLRKQDLLQLLNNKTMKLY